MTDTAEQVKFPGPDEIEGFWAFDKMHAPRPLASAVAGPGDVDRWRSASPRLRPSTTARSSPRTRRSTTTSTWRSIRTPTRRSSRTA